jgi:hypothetical protein
MGNVIDGKLRRVLNESGDKESPSTKSQRSWRSDERIELRAARFP